VRKQGVHLESGCVAEFRRREALLNVLTVAIAHQAKHVEQPVDQSWDSGSSNEHEDEARGARGRGRLEAKLRSRLCGRCRRLVRVERARARGVETSAVVASFNVAAGRELETVDA
jgi:hypothetical protein